MKVMRKLALVGTIIVSILFVGCATTKGVRDTRIADFKSSGSPCFDALLINMYAAGCTTIEQEGMSPPVVGKRVTCTVYADHADPSDGWLVNEFYVIHPSSGAPVDLHPMCFDTELIILWAERD